MKFSELNLEDSVLQALDAMNFQECTPVLKEEVEYRKLSQCRLAEQMGISHKMLNDILNCRRPVTAQTAMLFEAVLNIPADSLMRLQMKYNMRQAADNPSFMERLKEVRKHAAML